MPNPCEPQAIPQVVHLKDYAPPPYRIERVALRFELDERATVVTARLDVRAQEEVGPSRPLVLDGQELDLLSLHLDGRPLDRHEYTLAAESLTLHSPPRAFALEVVTRINPAANTALEGLYTSGGNFCTQCEAEGFRKITYFLDRPDNMSVYTTTLVADRQRYPVLLANGNCTEAGVLEDGRHFATWYDPFPKPSYLFAVVAGDLACVEERFTTAGGRDVALRLYVQHGNEDKCDHALRSLKKAMGWDEQVYGREYDLDIYMIVAVDDFNMGAMENKGLNIFNSKYVLARPDTATDSDFIHIEGVIAHEYFHNWSGNRVTCRDWFQLSLKEGFTVFRDQQFTADMNSAAVKRIQDVSLLRTHQFQEDAGPMSHPVRPESYVEINNFYTVTVYEKGAEVVRMLHTLLGPEGFRRGSDLYFARYDGQAVTTDDFVAAMEEANGVSLAQFRQWYAQAGTPEIAVSATYEPAEKRYTLTLTQRTPPTPGQPEKLPLHIPVALGLLMPGGGELPLQLEGESTGGGLTRVVELTEAEQRFVFVNVPERPVPSLLRGFSAPVRLQADYSDADLAFLMGHDTDPFNRWDAGQQLAVRTILRLVGDVRGQRPLRLEPALAEAFARTLQNEARDRSLVAEALTLPDEAYVAEFMEEVDPTAIHQARSFLRGALARANAEALWAIYRTLDRPGEYRIDAAAMGERALKNVCLGYLAELDDLAARTRCIEQVRSGSNMTDVSAALTTLVHREAPERHAVLMEFYDKWRHDPLVLDKWFAIQASAPVSGAVEEVRALVQHPDFNLRNPNRVRSVMGVFGKRNPSRFHDPSGAGYLFLGDQVVALDALNPQVAARLVEPLAHWRRYDPARQALMRAQLERIIGRPGVSRDVYEVVSKSLEA